ncbi:2780_t:CDS:2, partial [Entrophospora sp. SA101]
MQKVKDIHFLIDTGSPKTFICNETYDAFKVTITNASPHKMLINNKPIIAPLLPINSHFTDVNLLGTEYLKTFDTKLIVNFENEYVYMSFGSSQLGFYILSGIVGLVLFEPTQVYEEYEGYPITNSETLSSILPLPNKSLTTTSQKNHYKR